LALINEFEKNKGSEYVKELLKEKILSLSLSKKKLLQVPNWKYHNIVCRKFPGRACN
jgi:hypothetical protein